VIFGCMDLGQLKAEPDEPHALLLAEGEGLSWSIRRLIELIDDAIDTAGVQLARSAGLWADSPTPFDERDRPPTRCRSQLSSVRSPSDEPDRDRGIDLM
jgi:hypothetical protein